MASRKTTKISGGVNPDNVNVDFNKDIYQEVINLKDGEVKIIPNLNGDGHSIVSRFGRQITIVTKTYTRDHRFRKKILTDTTEINDGGVFVNGRKI